MIETITPIIFPKKEPFRRDMAVPQSLRGPDYIEKYDFSTFFYDAVYVAEQNKTVLICPKLFNFETLVKHGHFVDGTGRPVKHTINRYRRYDEVWLHSPATKFVFKSADEKFPFTSSADGIEHFSGKRSIVTISRNNEIPWIIDWLKFYRKCHGLEAALIFDNNSDIYDLETLDHELTEAVPELHIALVPANLSYGPRGVRHKRAHSKFLQTGMLNLARRRFLKSARSVLYVDIDEMVYSTTKKRVFQHAEKSRLGLATFRGNWVFPSNKTTLPIRHSDHFWTMSSKQEQCPVKWCVVPGSIAGDRNWDVHMVGNKLWGYFTRSKALGYFHCWSLGTNWKGTRGIINDEEMLQNELAIEKVRKPLHEISSSSG